MKTYRIPQTDLVVSRIAFGCGHLSQPRLAGFKDHLTADEMADAISKSRDAVSSAFADWKKGPPHADDIQLSTRVVNTAFDNGITLFDHADIYGFGKCESVFGEVLKQSPGLRQKIVIQTKCGIIFANEVLDPETNDPHRLDLSRKHILQSTETSLRRFGTDYIDLLLLHRPDPLVEPEEVAAAIDELFRSGKVRHFGVSNHTAAQISLLRKYVRQPLVVNQIHISLAHPYAIADGVEANREEHIRVTHGYTGVAGTLDYCRENNMQVQAWSPLKDGANKVNLINPPAHASQETKAAASLLTTIARRKKVSASAVALAWLLRHPAGIVPIIGTMNPSRIVDNSAADHVSLSREEWFELFAAAAGVPSLQLLGVSVPKK